jgi:hypothetical protein
MLCKAELNGAVLCVQDMLYAKNLIELIGMKVEFSIKLEINNKVAVDLISSFSVGGCTHHINVKQFFLRDLKEVKQLMVNGIPGSENSADMFTKNLDGPLFKRYAEQLLGEGALNRNFKKGGRLKVFLW